MAENHSGSGVVFRRALAVVAAMALLTSLAQVAAAEPSTEEKLDGKAVDVLYQSARGRTRVVDLVQRELSGRAACS